MALFTVYEVEVDIEDDEILDSISIEDFVDHHGSDEVAEYLVDAYSPANAADCVAEHGTDLLDAMDPTTVKRWLTGKVGAPAPSLTQAATALAEGRCRVGTSAPWPPFTGPAGTAVDEVAKAIGILMERRHFRLAIFDAIFKWGNFNEGA